MGLSGCPERTVRVTEVLVRDYEPEVGTASVVSQRYRYRRLAVDV
jgi:hypothetical protein